MKTRKLLGLLLLLVGALGFSGCSDEDDGYYHSVPGGGFGYRANTVHFYYVDGEGNSLVDEANPTTYPIPCEETDVEPSAPEEADEYGYYYPANWTNCRLGMDDEGKIYFNLSFPIDESTNTYSFHVYSNGSFDRFDLTYGYTDGAIGGDGWYAHVLSLKINGQHVYSDEEKREAEAAGCKVYLQKSGEETLVWSEY